MLPTVERWAALFHDAHRAGRQHAGCRWHAVYSILWFLELVELIFSFLFLLLLGRLFLDLRSLVKLLLLLGIEFKISLLTGDLLLKGNKLTLLLGVLSLKLCILVQKLLKLILQFFFLLESLNEILLGTFILGIKIPVG